MEDARRPGARKSDMGYKLPATGAPRNRPPQKRTNAKPVFRVRHWISVCFVQAGLSAQATEPDECVIGQTAEAGAVECGDDVVLAVVVEVHDQYGVH